MSKCKHKCCDKPVEYYEEYEEDGWCEEHISNRAPEYTVICPKCDTQICVN